MLFSRLVPRGTTESRMLGGVHARSIDPHQFTVSCRVAGQGRAGAIDGHCEWLLRDVRVPVANRLGIEGAGFALAVAPKGLI